MALFEVCNTQQSSIGSRQKNKTFRCKRRLRGKCILDKSKSQPRRIFCISKLQLKWLFLAGIYAQLKTVEQERHALARVKAELYLAEKQNQCLLTKVQQVKKERNTAKAQLETVEQERDTAKAQLETVEQERDRANKRYKTAIAEWARLERAAYGTPGLGGI